MRFRITMTNEDIITISLHELIKKVYPNVKDVELIEEIDYQEYFETLWRIS